MTWYLPFKISIAKTDVFAIECLDQLDQAENEYNTSVMCVSLSLSLISSLITFNDHVPKTLKKLLND